MERQHNALDQRVDSKHQRQYAKDPNKQIQTWVLQFCQYFFEPAMPNRFPLLVLFNHLVDGCMNIGNILCDLLRGL